MSQQTSFKHFGGSPVSEKNPSRNCLKSSWSGESTVNLWVYYGQEIMRLPHFAGSQSLFLRPIQTFRTDSLGNRVNRGKPLALATAPP